eukprot:GHVQ01008170.1.p3 GENE.GHVQ01008170.1~~GHVQ01008170.1.p3  ORF type:complete len:110 (+),score=15.33 GHVQ01008170.1:26-355(+)
MYAMNVCWMLAHWGSSCVCIHVYPCVSVRVCLYVCGIVLYRTASLFVCAASLWLSNILIHSPCLSHVCFTVLRFGCLVFTACMRIVPYDQAQVQLLSSAAAQLVIYTYE